MLQISKELIKNISVIVGVYTVQLLFHHDFFRCPCTQHKIYGSAFLVAPAISLLAVSLVISKRSWSVMVACWKHKNKTARCNHFLDFLVDFFRPFFASGVWFIVALLRGEYYVCIRGGPAKKSCISNGEETVLVDVDKLYAQSFIIGAVCLVGLLIFIAGLVCIQRLCTSANNADRLPTIDDFNEMKSMAIGKVFEDKSKALANEFAVNLVEGLFRTQEADVETDECFYLARERLLRDQEHRQQNEYMINCPENDEFTSMEFSPM